MDNPIRNFSFPLYQPVTEAVQGYSVVIASFTLNNILVLRDISDTPVIVESSPCTSLKEAVQGFFVVMAALF
ncbi:hypothetical protein CQ056_22405 [Peribacillus simplex]|nr:hypothetical protein CQ056_22405 [Peribacillus simplex]